MRLTDIRSLTREVPGARFRDVLPASVDVIGGEVSGNYCTNPAIVAALLEASAPCEATDFASLHMQATGSRAGGHSTHAVLNILLRDGGAIMQRVILAAIQEANSDDQPGEG